MCFLIRVPELGHYHDLASICNIHNFSAVQSMDVFLCFCFVTDLSLTGADPLDLTSGVGNDALNNANISGSTQTLVHILCSLMGTLYKRLF